jgi:hypothetical protein
VLFAAVSATITAVCAVSVSRIIGIGIGIRSRAGTALAPTMGDQYGDDRYQEEQGHHEDECRFHS